MAELRITLSGLPDDEARDRGNELAAQFMQLCRDDPRFSYRCVFVADERLREERLASRRDEADAGDGAELARLLRRLLDRQEGTGQ